jgi:LAO/AO transport system kinase
MEHQDGTFETALQERGGVEQPSNVNPAFARKAREAHETCVMRPQELSVADYVSGILQGNRTILSRAITMVESTLPKHQEIAQQIIEKCLPYSGNSLRVGITGVPGAGKSTFIEALGTHLVRSGDKLAVLAIDPSSERSKGSILGDKTRMEELSGMENAFIRPSPSAGSLGGVARKTRETVVLCEASGFNRIFIETVGVGQSETTATRMVDYFLLLQVAGTGDELQGIKRGIMEMADGIAINKADGDNVQKARLAAAQFRNALALFPLAASGWKPAVEVCSSYTKDGISDVWAQIEEYERYTKSTGYFDRKRTEQMETILKETLTENLLQYFFGSEHNAMQINDALQKVKNSEESPYIAAQRLLKNFLQLV